MAKKSSTTHPKMHEITVVFTNGQTMRMRISAGRYDKDTLHLQSDPLTPRAWRAKGEARMELRGERAQKIASRFMKFDLE